MSLNLTCGSPHRPPQNSPKITEQDLTGTPKRTQDTHKCKTEQTSSQLYLEKSTYRGGDQAARTGEEQRAGAGVEAAAGGALAAGAGPAGAVCQYPHEQA